MEKAKGGIIVRTHAEEVLELPKILSILAEYCQTQPAKNRLGSIVAFKNRVEAEDQLNRITDILRFGHFAEFYAPFEPGCLRQESAIVQHLSIEQISFLNRFLLSVQNLKNRFSRTDIKHYFNILNEYTDILDAINSVIDQNGEIKDDASPELFKIRKRKKEIKNRMRIALNTILTERKNIFTSSNIVERAGRFVLPVKSNFKNDFEGIVHAYSNTAETVFIEPTEIANESAKLIEVENQEAQEIEAILIALTDKVKTRIEDIENDIEVIISLDLLFAKARFASDFSATMPLFSNRINIMNGYHPILKRITDKVIPLNLNMEPDKNILLISGPNAGGKTVVLKTVGLIALMAKYGLFIPAEEGSTIPFFEELYADIGDEQSIESQLSTFAGHLRQIRDALNSKENSLVLFDELMSQTSAEEGSALAAAIMEKFAQRKSMVLATTHNEDLKLFVSKKENMLNAGMEFTDHPTYRLIIGIPQPSNAIKLAKQLGINGGIIEAAYGYLDKEKVSLNELFTDLSRELGAVQEERKKLSSLIKDYETKLNDLNLRKKNELEQLKSKYKNELIQSKRAIEGLIKTLKKEGPKPAKIAEARQFFGEKLQIEEDRKPYYPQINEIVRIAGLKRFGQVVAQHQGKFKVSLENMFFWVEPQDIEPVEKG